MNEPFGSRMLSKQAWASVYYKWCVCVDECRKE